MIESKSKEELKQEALDAYTKVVAPACKVYEKAIAPAWKVYEKANRLAGKAYEKVDTPFWKAYKKATAQTLEIYEKRLKEIEKICEIKVYKCRYCTNSSNEGEGILAYNKYTKQKVWICMPCYEIFRNTCCQGEKNMFRLNCWKKSLVKDCLP